MRRYRPKTLRLILLGFAATGVVALCVFGALTLRSAPWTDGPSPDGDEASAPVADPVESGGTGDTVDAGDAPAEGQAAASGAAPAAETGPAEAKARAPTPAVRASPAPAITAADDAAALRNELSLLRDEIKALSERLAARIDAGKDGGDGEAGQSGDSDAGGEEGGTPLARMEGAVKAVRLSVDGAREEIAKLRRAVSKLREEVGELQISLELIEKQLEKKGVSRRRP